MCAVYTINCALQAANGGIVMVSFFNQFLNCNEKATMKDVIGENNYRCFILAKPMISLDCAIFKQSVHTPF